MTAKALPDPNQALAGAMGAKAPQPIKFGGGVDPMVRFDQKTSGRANKAALSLGATPSLMNAGNLYGTG